MRISDWSSDVCSSDLQRIGQDFGATVHFDMKIADAAFGGFKPSGPEALIARAQTDKYPKNAEYAEKGFFLSTIDYGRRGGGAWPQRGTVIYLKSAMIDARSEEHTSELQSLMRISYAVFCLKKKR